MNHANAPSAELIGEFVRGYVLASYLYYGADTPSPWTDREFDSCVGFLEYWRERWPFDFRIRVMDGDLKTEAHALQFDADEKAAALAWSASGAHWPRA